MGRAKRPCPERLAAKLLAIRLHFNVSQAGLLEVLKYKQSPLFPGHISEFERGEREPPLPLLLRYARAAEVTLEMLVDDDLEMPGELSQLTLLARDTTYPPKARKRRRKRARRKKPPK